MIAWFARHPVAANLLMAAIMILGLVTLPNLQRETFPEIKNDKVEIGVIYKGATTDEVEDAICRRIEDALDGITDIGETRCEAREGQGIATAVMREGADITRFLDDVKSEVEAIDDFPDDAELPIIKELGRTDAVVSIAITGPEDPVALKAYAEQVRARLQVLREISTVEITGFSAHQIRVEIPVARLRQHGLSTADIARTVEQQSVGLPAGELQGEFEDVLLRFDDQRKRVADFENLVVISSVSGAAIRLGDIATISNRFERDEEQVLFNGKRAAILDVTKTRAQDILTAYHAVADFVARENRNTPDGIRLTLTQDRSSIVSDRLNMLIRNGVQGLIGVFLILWLFFSIRYSFWVTMGLPVSFLGALFVLPALGVTINMISMVGLLIGVGLLMDDAIVIAENIASRMARGDKPLDAAVNGVSQVLPGVLSSFATTLLVFGSLAFITGEIGQVLKVMPIVLIMVISVSLIEAFWILPSHLGHSLMHMEKRQTNRFRGAFERAFERLRKRHFATALGLAIRHRYLTVGSIIMLLLIAIAMPIGGKLKFTGFPDIEGNVVEARLLLPQGTPLRRTEQIVQQLQQAAADINQTQRDLQPDGQDLVQNVTVIYGQNPDAYESGPHVARVIVDLLDAEIRNTPLDEFRNQWRERIGNPTDVIAIKFTEPTVGPGGRAIDVRLIGEDLEQVKLAALELRQWFAQYDGVIDLSDDLRPGKREYRLHLKDSAGALGLNAESIANQVRAAFQGFKTDEFPLGAETYEVDIRVSANDRRNLDDLEALTIFGPDGSLVPLPAIANIEETRGWARINRVDGRRAVTIQGDVDRDRANAQELLTLAGQTVFRDIVRHYPAVTIDIQGASDRSARTGSSIGRNVLLGMIGVYMLLALHFRGYLAPITVMSVIPTALIGVVFGHMALGLDLTLPSIVGMASLFGVVVNDSILLVVFIRDERAAGISVQQAARDAAIARFRPIVLTSITTIAGLTPLLTEQSLQAQILIPLAASLAFGLMSATLIALFLVPALYCILDDFNALGEIDPLRSRSRAAGTAQETAGTLPRGTGN
jgi:multidrug efflux pump subunit AcrB